ncbi:membrane protein [Streptomyces hiroshimensis]|uniref:Membrane protein n=1 Tax=Streptomyces hiroshimensis TaxID=66424 RepID=A0ABQ2Z3S2_9ACTN|nr:membrane protein [Streptomyces hiroshimensis]
MSASGGPSEGPSEGAPEGASGEASGGAPGRTPAGASLARRLLQLYVGLALYGASAGLQLRAGLGLAPWDVLNQGVAKHMGMSIGTASIAIGALVLLLWIPLRQRPGLGTVSNVLVIGLAMDATLSLVPDPRSLWIRIPLLAFAVALCAVATGLYISARFGPGPRDGLMTGLHRRTGRSVRLVRTCIEVVVLATGFVLGGSVGLGTVFYALAIGPLSQFFLRLFALPEPAAPAPVHPAAHPPVRPAEREVPDLV